MTAYLLDTNLLIQAKNDYYGFDLCPGFWEWLDRMNVQKRIFSVKQVCDELIRGSDDLSEWAADRKESFFLPSDQATISAMQRVSNWVQSQDYMDSAKRTFLSGADPDILRACSWPFGGDA